MVYKHDGWTLHNMNLEREIPDLESNRYDVVVSEQVIEHLHNPHLALSEMYRVLRTGGQMVLGVPTFPPGGPFQTGRPHRQSRGLSWLLFGAVVAFALTATILGRYNEFGITSPLGRISYVALESTRPAQQLLNASESMGGVIDFVFRTGTRPRGKAVPFGCVAFGNA